MVRRFVAGETREEGLRAAERLVAEGFVTTLDFLGEHVTKPEEADSACEEYCQLLERMHVSPAYGGWMPERINLSIKLSQMGLDFDVKGCAERLACLLSHTVPYRDFIRIDMESSDTVDATLDCFWRVRPRYPNVGVVLQAMLYRTPKDLEVMIREGVRVRLVKGAYLESPRVAYPSKKDVDCAYWQLAQRLLLEGIYPAFATHDEKLILAIKEFARAHSIGRGRFEFQMLYGVRRSLQKRLRDEGYIVRIYIPYGKSWYPYFTRRLAERPANLFFFLRSLFQR
ncbi:MAG: proline dehydrogenase family protein [Fimbriimonadales bacterium]|nr:proline dehydrogenase family protein [Fimbriimonadales bacterium]